MAADTWKRALTEAGFDQVVGYPRGGIGGGDHGADRVHCAGAADGCRPRTARASRTSRHYRGVDAACTADAVDAGRDAEALRARLADALPDEQEEILVEFVRGHVAGVLRLGSVGDS